MPEPRRLPHLDEPLTVNPEDRGFTDNGGSVEVLVPVEEKPGPGPLEVVVEPAIQS